MMINFVVCSNQRRFLSNTTHRCIHNVGMHTRYTRALKRQAPSKVIRHSRKLNMQNYKVSVLGAGGVGKSSLVKRFLKKDFNPDHYEPTVEESHTYLGKAPGMYT